MVEGQSSADIVVSKEAIEKAPLAAVVVCGMGPVRLMDRQGSDRLIPPQPYMRVNAISSKLLAANHITDTVIVSGTATAPESATPRERAATEAAVLADTYDRMAGKNMPREGVKKAAERITLDPNAKTTFGNIIEALNVLDKQNGYFDGEFGILSAQFHMPRINEMITAFGLKNTRPIAAEGVLRHYNYREDRFYPTQDFGYGKTYEELEEETYQGQPAGLQNLQENPSYVTFELAAVQSDKRLQEMATSLRDYYKNHGVIVPPVYDRIPEQFDVTFDYDALRKGFSEIPFTKEPYRGEVDTKAYRELAKGFADQTETFLAQAA